MIYCPGCKKTKIDDQFIKYNRDGNKLPTRICRPCRDKRVFYYNKKKLFQHDKRDWTLNMDLRSGRRLTVTRLKRSSSMETPSSNKRHKPTELPLPLQEATPSADSPPPADTMSPIQPGSLSESVLIPTESQSVSS